MDRLLRLGGAGMGMGQNAQPTDAPVVDTAEQVYISSLALLKMLKHGRAGNFSYILGLKQQNKTIDKVSKKRSTLFKYHNVF